MNRILPPATFHEEKLSTTEHLITINAPHTDAHNKPVEYGRAIVYFVERFPLKELRIDDPGGNEYTEAFYIASLDIWHPYTRRGYGLALTRHIERTFGQTLPITAISTDESNPFWRATGWRHNIDNSTGSNVYSYNTELITLQHDNHEQHH